MNSLKNTADLLPAWISKLPFNLQLVIGGAICAHIVLLILVITMAMGKSGKKPPFSADLKKSK